jgi:choline-sulfatase
MIASNIFLVKRASQRSVLILSAIVVVAISAAQGQKPGTARVGATRVSATPDRVGKPDVILITIDTLRADHVGCYGAQNVDTPALDGLAHDGVVFERAISQVPLTWPSHAVILTGTYPFQNGVQDFTGEPLGEKFRSVAQSFKSAGYATGAVVSAFVLDRSWGLARGFDYYDDEFAASEFRTKDLGLVERRAGDSVARGIAWLKKTPRRPVFLWLHLYDPHSPYDPPEPFHSKYSEHLYDGEIAYADHELEKLIAWLKQNGVYESSLIVMVSDHGESLGEHGEDEHGFFVYNATVHVPLIVKPPAGSGISAGRQSHPVQIAAVAPTLLELAGLENVGVRDTIWTQFQDSPLFAIKDGKEPAYSETFYPFSSFGWSPLRALESERFHFIDAPKPELYDLVADPAETRNIAADQPATVRVFQEKLKTLLARNPFGKKEGAAGAGNLSPDTQAMLRALGYFGFRAAVSPEALKEGLADPKDKLWEFNAILKAEHAYGAQRDEEAEALLRQVEEKDPQIYVIPFLLGESALRYGKWDDAAKELQRCLELNPNFDNAMTGLALALTKLERDKEADNWLDKAVQVNPQNYRAWYQKGLLESRNDVVAARAAYEKAIAIQPNFAPGQRDLGMLLFEQKNYSGAAVHLAKAVALGVDDARVHNFLGICYAKTNRMESAVREHRRAIELDPKLAEAHLNLGFVYEKLGKTAAARAEYDRACQLSEPMCAFVRSRENSAAPRSD